MILSASLKKISALDFEKERLSLFLRTFAHFPLIKLQANELLQYIKLHFWKIQKQKSIWI